METIYDYSSSLLVDITNTVPMIPSTSTNANNPTTINDTHITFLVSMYVSYHMILNNATTYLSESYNFNIGDFLRRNSHFS